MRHRLALALCLLFLCSAAAADGPQLQSVGIGVLDAITGVFRSYMKFMTGSFAPFAAVIGGTAALVFLVFSPKEGVMATVLKWVGVSVAVLAVPSIVVTLQGLI